MNDSTSPLSSLDLPDRIQKLLEKSGITSIDELVVRLEEDPKSILAIGGIGPKTLLDISAALESFGSLSTGQYPEPVQSLGDQFKSMSPDESMTVAESAENREEEKKKGEKSKKVGKKKDKKPKKNNKKKKKSKKPHKKKGKKSKKSKGQKAKKSKKK